MNKQSPKVSIIVPVYNVAPYLPRCLDSLLAQTLRDIEIICVDDKSTDNSLEILREYAGRDKRVRVIALEKNSGVSVARNSGMDVALGEYLGFVDSDDYLDADFYEKLYAAAKKTGSDMSRGGYRETLTNGKTTVYDGIVHDILTNGKWYCMHQAWGIIYRAEMLRRNNIKLPTEIRYAEDLLFLTQCVAAANNVAATAGTYYNYVRRDDSLDCPVLSPAKISDLIVSCDEITNVYNQSSAISHHDYASCYAVIINRLQLHFNRTTSIHAQQQICTAIIDLYRKCRTPLSVMPLLSGFNRPALECIRKLDAGTLGEILHAGAISQRDDFYLFSSIPVCRITKTTDRFIMRVFSIQVLKIKPVPTDFRLWILYIPIIRRKRKYKG